MTSFILLFAFFSLTGCTRTDGSATPTAQSMQPAPAEVNQAKVTKATTF